MLLSADWPEMKCKVSLMSVKNCKLNGRHYDVMALFHRLEGDGVNIFSSQWIQYVNLFLLSVHSLVVMVAVTVRREPLCQSLRLQTP